MKWMRMEYDSWMDWINSNGIWISLKCWFISDFKFLVVSFGRLCSTLLYVGSVDR